jgi:CHAT domain-containing protein
VAVFLQAWVFAVLPLHFDGAPAPAANAFVRALRVADWSAPLWDAERESLERIVSVHIDRSVTLATGQRGNLVAIIDGVGQTADGKQQVLPAQWHLRIENGILTGVETEGGRLARAISSGQHIALPVSSSNTLLEAARRLARLPRCDAECRNGLALLLETARNQTNRMAAAYVLCALARAEPDRASEFLDEALLEARMDADVTALVHVVRGDVAGDPETRDACFEAAVELLPRLEDATIGLEALRRRANEAYEHFRLPDAYAFYTELLSRSHQVRWTRGVMYGIYGQSRVNAASSDFAAARAQAEEAACYAAALRDADIESRARNLYGQTLTFEGRVEEAVPILVRGLEAARSDDFEIRAFLHTNLAKCFLKLDERDLTDLHADAAMDAARQSPRPVLMAYEFASLLGRLAGRCQESLALSREALREHQDSLWLIWSVKARLAQTLIACSGESAEAIRHLYDAVDLIEARRVLSPVSDYRQVSTFAAHLWVYRTLVATLVDAGRDEEALAVAQRMKARLLGDKIAGTGRKPTLDKAARARERALNERIVTLNRERLRERDADHVLLAQLKVAREELASFWTEMALRHPELRFLTPYGGQVAKSFAPDEAALAFVELEERTLVFVVRSSGVTAEILAATPSTLAKEVAKFRRLIEERDITYAEQARRMYEMLIKRVEPHLNGVRELIIVPDATLWLIPFEALMPSKDRFLIDRYTISYRNALGVRGQRSPRPRAPETFIAFADPALRSRERNPPLPEAAAEARAISSLYGKSGRVFLGTDARESDFKRRAPAYDVIHLASHASQDSQSPFFSAILLSADDHGNDGVLEAREVMSLGLRANLVVLAACDTAGTVAPGEGILGLAWSFLAAGANDVIVTRWNAESYASSRVMVTFHENRARHGMNVYEALRAATRTLRADARYEHPFYWALFIGMNAQ